MGGRHQNKLTFDSHPPGSQESESVLDTLSSTILNITRQAHREMDKRQYPQPAYHEPWELWREAQRRGSGGAT